MPGSMPELKVELPLGLGVVRPAAKRLMQVVNGLGIPRRLYQEQCIVVVGVWIAWLLAQGFEEMLLGLRGAS